MTALSPLLATTTPDPTKHVKYTLGMVLGADDFDQEFAYLSERDQWLARNLLGYGTVRGLRVYVDTDPATSTPEVVVDPGVALTPEGHLVRVKVKQCAVLNAWLAANKGAFKVVPPVAPSPLSTIVLYVVIAYVATPTDMVPIPGEPCRSQDDASAPSRLADDFSIQLASAPPGQVEEDALQDLLAWLGAVQIVASGGVAIDAFLGALRSSIPLTKVNPTPPPAYLPPASPPYYLVPPATPLKVNAGDFPGFFRAAVRLYVTELRANDVALTPAPATPPNAWIDTGQTAQGDPPAETRLLLAKLTLPVSVDGSGNATLGGTPVVDDSARPYLVPAELLKTVLLASSAATARTGAYTVLAAGTVPVLAAAPAALNPGTFNGIVAQATGAGEVTVTFSGSGASDPPNLHYVAKVIALPLGASTVLDAVVSLKSFPPAPAVSALVPNARAFTLRVRNGGADVAQANLATLSLVIEISSYLAAS